MDNASDTNENAATTTKRTHGMLLIKTPSPSRRRRRRIVASPGGCVPRRGTTSSPAITARIRTAPRSMPLSSPVAPNRTSTHFRTPPPRRSRPPPRHAVGFALEDLTNQNEYVDSLSIGGDDDEVFSVISCDGEASPHVTELDFLSFNQNGMFSCAHVSLSSNISSQIPHRFPYLLLPLPHLLQPKQNLLYYGPRHYANQLQLLLQVAFPQSEHHQQAPDQQVVAR